MTDHARVAFFAVRRRMNRDLIPRGVMHPLGLHREPGYTQAAILFDKRNTGELQTCSR